MSTETLRLYISGFTTQTQTLIDDLRLIFATDLADWYTLEVIDALGSPERAKQDGILATPTLVKDLPAPARRIIGDLSSRHQVLLGLEILSTGDSKGTDGGSDA